MHVSIIPHIDFVMENIFSMPVPFFFSSPLKQHPRFPAQMANSIPFPPTFLTDISGAVGAARHVLEKS
jgi:hypothetical protein